VKKIGPLFRSLRRVLVLLVMVVGLALAYFHVYGFPPWLEQRIVNELTRQNIDARFGRLRLDLWRGLVAENAELYLLSEPDRPIAEVDEVAINLSVRQWIRKGNIVHALKIENARLKVPLTADEKGPVVINASEAHATFTFPRRDSVRIERLTGIYLGVRLNVVGELKLPPAEEAAPKPPVVATAARQLLSDIVRELGKVHAETPPILDIDFTLDLANPRQLTMEVALNGSNLRYRALQLDAVRVSARYREERLELPTFHVRVYDGHVRARGFYDLANGRVDLDVFSSTDVTKIASLFSSKVRAAMREWRFAQNPLIACRFMLDANTGGTPKVDVVAKLGGFWWRNVRFESLETVLDFQNPRLQIAQFSLASADGKLKGDGEYNVATHDFRYAVTSTLNFRRLESAMTTNLQEWIQQWTFEDLPKVELRATGSMIDPTKLAYDGHVEVGASTFRGQQIRRGTATLRLRDECLHMPDVWVARDEGEIRADVKLHFGEHWAEFVGTSTANIRAVAAMLGPAVEQAMKPLEMGDDSNVRASGYVSFTQPERTAWEAHVEGRDVSYVPFWHLTAARAEVGATFTNNTLTVSLDDSEFYNGKLRGHARLDFGHTQAVYEVKAFLERGDLGDILAAATGQKQSVDGVLTCTLDINGLTDDLATMKGWGDLIIEEGFLLNVPIFGPITSVLDDIHSGLGSVKASRAKATFTIADNAISTSDLEVFAGPVTLAARGKVSFDCKLEFKTQAKILRALPGINIPFAILGKVFEYHIGGTCDNPSRRPMYLPKEIMP
jgi:hypothetical protein